MVEWSEDHVAAIGRSYLNWRPDGALRWKVETVGWEGRGVGCGKPTPSRL
jgi:hypothetical protein